MVSHQREFLRASQAGDLSRLETLVAKCNVSDWTVFRHVSGDTALHVAAREGHLNVVRYLCEGFEGLCAVDVANNDSKRALHEAAQFSQTEVLKYLIIKGAAVDSLKRADWTPLMLACTKTGPQACECISELLKAKADPFLRNKDGWTPLLIVCRAGDENAFNLLANHSVKCTEDRSNNGRSALLIAAFHGHQRIIELLVRLNPSLLNSRDSSGSTPLQEAIKGGHLNAGKLLIQLGADFRATDNIGYTILHVAALTGNVKAVEYILGNNFIDIHCKALFNVTPLAAAGRGDKIDTIECLLKHGATE